jgi:tetratricopeptide (TPR) repeat protein
MKVAVYTIALNEAPLVDRYMDAVGEADLVAITDTGSTDGTVDRLRHRGATVHQLSIRPWRFDDARNASLALLPDDVDVCVVVDLDEVLPVGWRDVLEREWGDATRGRYLYVFNHLPDGSPDLSYWHDRIHARHGYRWVYACHEHLVADRIDERYTTLTFEMHQYADRNKSRAHYLELLEVNAAEHPHLPRAAHYLGREYVYLERWSDALRELVRHVEMPESVWGPERAASYRLMAQCLTALGRDDEAIEALRSATEEAPQLRESWVALAQGRHDRRHWQECFDAATRALAITTRPSDYFNEGWAWGARADDLASVSAWWLGRVDEALDHARRAAAIDPGDERLRANVEYIETHRQPQPQP